MDGDRKRIALQDVGVMVEQETTSVLRVNQHLSLGELVIWVRLRLGLGGSAILVDEA